MMYFNYLYIYNYIIMSKYQNYFKHIGEHIVDNVKYDVYQPHGFALILKSKFGRVLASIQVFYDDEDILTQKCPIPVPFEGGFQIIFQSEDSDSRIESGRPIKYIISNHCKESGYVKIDLGYNKIPSMETDPAENINNINELRSFESVEIKSNQLEEWKQLMVKTKKKKNIDGTTTIVTLQEEVDATHHQKLGTYLYLTVTPQKYCSLSELFIDSYWSPEDLIIVEKNYVIDNIIKRNELYKGRQIKQGIIYDQIDQIEQILERREILENVEVQNPIGMLKKNDDTFYDNHATKNTNDNSSLFSKLFSSIKNKSTVDKSVQSGNLEKCHELSDTSNSFNRQTTTISKSSGFSLSKIFSKFGGSESQQFDNKNNFEQKSDETMKGVFTSSTPPFLDEIAISKKQNICDDVIESDGDSTDEEINDLIGDSIDNEIYKENINAQTFNQVEKTINSCIMKSKVAELIGGDTIIQQFGNKTHVSYDFSVRTEPRKIGLSVMDLSIIKLYPLITTDEIKVLVSSYLDAIKHFKDMEFVELAKSIKKYRSDVCTVCLDPDTPPSVVLVRCGHICTCSDDCSNILNNKCPMCQTQILCRINEAVFASNC